MKTALKVIGGIFATLIAAVAIFYFGWLSPPSADSVCDNVVKLTVAELESKGAKADDAAKKSLEAKCTKVATTPPEFGKGPWVKRLKCMRDAEDFAALEKCEDIRSM